MKPITKVFLIIGVLLACLLVWSAFFTEDGGVLALVWNTIADTLNDIFGKITGGSTDIVPDWGDFGGTDLEAGKDGF